jgi:uncharacterized protein YggE
MSRRRFSALVVAAALAAFRPIALRADDATAPASPRLRTITVSGEGEASGAPDVAVTTLGVEALDPKLGDAIADVSRRMRAVVEAVKRAGVAARDVRTVEYSVNFEQNPPPPRSSDGRPSGNYRVRNMAQVTIRDLPRAGEVLDASAAAGANEISGIAFTIEDPAPLRTRAREAAVADARARAEALARASGVGVGAVVSISESSGSSVPRPMLARAMASVAPGAPPIESGELTERAEVEIVFEIGKRAP